MTLITRNRRRRPEATSSFVKLRVSSSIFVKRTPSRRPRRAKPLIESLCLLIDGTEKTTSCELGVKSVQIDKMHQSFQPHPTTFTTVCSCQCFNVSIHGLTHTKGGRSGLFHTGCFLRCPCESQLTLRGHLARSTIDLHKDATPDATSVTTAPAQGCDAFSERMQRPKETGTQRLQCHGAAAQMTHPACTWRRSPKWTCPLFLGSSPPRNAQLSPSQLIRL